MNVRLALAIGFAAGAFACSKHDRDEPPAPGPLPFDETKTELPPGTSDLTLDDKGTIWAVAERGHIISEITGFPAGPPKIILHPVDGVPEGIDTEAITWLGDSRFAIGTEGQDTPTASVLFAELHPDNHFVVTRERPLASAELGVTLSNNHGVEGICGTGDDLLVAIETVGKNADGRRWAPLVRLHGDATSHARLWLTTAVGKISALSCTFGKDGSIDVLAIERHYGVSRILHATIAADAAGSGAKDVTPTVVVDLFPYNHDRFNLEGIVKLPDGRLVLVNDNQGSRVDGPTELLVIHPR